MKFVKKFNVLGEEVYVKDFFAREYLKFNDKNILILGDSLSDEGYALSSPNWVTYFRTKIEEVGGTVTNVSHVGRTFSASREDNLISVLGGIPTGEYTDIIVFLGVNDWASDATLEQMSTAFDSLNDWIVGHYPTAHVHMCTPVKSDKSFNPDVPLDYYRTILIKQGAMQHGWSIIDTFAEAPMYNGNVGNLRNLYTLDGLHFKPTYAPVFAEYMLRRVLNGTSSYVALFGTQVVLSNFFDNKNLIVYYNSNGILSAYIDLGNYTPSSKIVQIGTLPVWAKPILDTCNVVYSSSGGNFKPIHVYIPTNGNVYLCFPDTGIAYSPTKILFNYMINPVLRPNIS